ncbi:uncharacterized protein JN550_008476 [Neoarthrinium moseri]|uniref:uncharacterized protein n=1 Tax=Neoarthrinium moseri TaxID=1658444 RepID=UPI001FDB4D78|nr:uncharacterized protein JN550_008476 [Neoarthrinium moseri]KAI1865428.1 hypothetical protein JN550_008476 [Neoarthrinium moseri]
MEYRLAPGLVVLNKKYFPRNSLTAAQVGASSFTFSVLRILRDARILSGIILYSRDENLEIAQCQEEESWDGVPVVTVSFNFRMDKSTVAPSLAKAFQLALARGLKTRSPIVYYQTDTLLQYHPDGFRFCVTHHGPFVSHFTEEFSPELAKLAFGGDSNKVAVLDQQQQTGVERLLQDGLGTVLAHSGLQQRVLQDEGLQASRFKRLRPPIGVPPSESPDILPENMKNFIYEAELLLFTAVARLDYFKNVELLVQSGLELLRRGIPVRILVVGDPDNDSYRREALMESIPPLLRSKFLILPRLSKDHLYALFASAQHNGIFICPSRYETLGITPLEAAASGVTTLMAGTRNVEAISYMPACCHVAQDTSSIATRVQMIYEDGIPVWADMVKNHVRPATSLEGFRDDLLRAWREMSRYSKTMPAPVAQNTRYRSDKRKPSIPSLYLSDTFMEMLRLVSV